MELEDGKKKAAIRQTNRRKKLKTSNDEFNSQVDNLKEELAREQQKNQNLSFSHQGLLRELQDSQDYFDEVEQELRLVQNKCAAHIQHLTEANRRLEER